MVEDRCEFCLDKTESLCHIFYDCVWAILMWNIMSLDWIEEHAFASFSDCLNDIFSKISDDELKTFLVVCWWIWSNRNKSIIEHTCARVDSCKIAIQKWLLENRMLDHAFTNPVKQHHAEWPTVWKKPDVGWTKINYDASFRYDSYEKRYGLVVCNSHGQVVHAESGCLGMVEDAFQAETLALQRAVTWAASMELNLVVFEGDCQLLFKEVVSQ
ncbi:uncharacterized protein [Rutidosis leptorrhynchoides]|uniref:uncharacterized protein n=1 Tax=Rutidosis leptorrhynchoides TaxID=125765 RepID=UPI003A995BB2